MNHIWVYPYQFMKEGRVRKERDENDEWDGDVSTRKWMGSVAYF